jgi:hypothetical protein
MLTNIILTTDPPPLLTGSDLSDSIWKAVGPGLSLIAVLVIIFVFFVGQNRNIKAGVACLVGLAVLIAIAVNTSILQGWGTTITGLFSKAAGS